jgi:hypothetical protein
MKQGDLIQTTINDVPAWGINACSLGRVRKNDYVIFVSYTTNINYVKVISKYGLCEIGLTFIT